MRNQNEKKIKIGDVKLKGNLALAPMLSVTDLGFRILCREKGAALAYTEMISSDAIVKAENTSIKFKNLVKTNERDKLLSMQIFGNNHKIMAKAAKILEKKADIIDINIGCPSPKIVNNKSGAYLLTHLKTVGKIIKSVKSSINIPLSVKARIGVDKKNVVINELAEICERNNVDALAIHGRTLKQGYSGKADWNVIKDIKKEFPKLKIIANGDIFSREDIKKILDFTKADMAMIGRGAIGNPGIFSDKKYADKDKAKDFLRYMKIAEETETLTLTRLRQQAVYFTKSMRNAKELRKKIVETRKLPDDKAIGWLTRIFEEIAERE